MKSSSIKYIGGLSPKIFAVYTYGPCAAEKYCYPVLSFGLSEIIEPHIGGLVASIYDLCSQFG